MSETKSNVTQRTKEELRADGVTLLGSGHTEYVNKYDPSILQTFENKHPDNDYLVSLDGYEATALCPVTGQPDFAKFVINYIPNKRLVESKSLKLYFFSFRETGTYHEDFCNTVMKDLRDLMQPKYIEVVPCFAARGGWAIKPMAQWVNPEFPEYNEIAKARLIDQMNEAAKRTLKYDM